METKIIRDMESCYLVIVKEAETGFQQKMVLHNQIDGIMSVEERQVDNITQYYYQVTNSISLREYLNRGALTSEQIQYILEKVISQIQCAKAYLLEQNNFILNVDCIYLGVDGKNIEICFYEGYQKDIREQLLELVANFMEYIDYNDEKAVKITYAIYKCLRDDSCSFESMLNTFESVCAKTENQVMTSSTSLEDSKPSCLQQQICVDRIPELLGQNTYQEVNQKFYLLGTAVINSIAIVLVFKTRYIFYQSSHAVNINRVLIAAGIFLAINIIFNQLWTKLKRNHGVEIIDTSMFDEQGDTIVLSNLGSSHFQLKREGGNDVILISEFPFTIGYSRKQSQGIAPYPGVSKKHIVISKRGHEIMVKDLNSTNGTFLNGELIEPEREYKLNDEDKLTLGKVTYQFLAVSV